MDDKRLGETSEISGGEALVDDELLKFVPPRRKPKKAPEAGTRILPEAASAAPVPVSVEASEAGAPEKADLSQPIEQELKTAEATTGWFVKMEPEEEKARRLTKEKNRPLVIAVVILAFLIIAVGVVGYSLVESGFRF